MFSWFGRMTLEVILSTAFGIESHTMSENQIKMKINSNKISKASPNIKHTKVKSIKDLFNLPHYSINSEIREAKSPRDYNLHSVQSHKRSPKKLNIQPNLIPKTSLDKAESKSPRRIIQ